MKYKRQKTNYTKKNNPNYRGGKDIPCAYCGKLVYRTPYEIKRSKNSFCSSKCHDEFRRKPKDENRLKLEDMKGEKHPRWSGSKYCPICKKELLTRKERQLVNCGSEKCISELRKKSAKKAKMTQYGKSAGRGSFICQYCKKEIKTTSSVAKNRKFCSHKCNALAGSFLKSTGPTALEIAVAEALKKLNLKYKSEYSPIGSPGIYDFYVQKLNLLIEADGDFWHHSEWADEKFNVVERDKRKTDWAEENGFNLIRLRERDVNNIGALILLKKELKNIRKD